MQYIDKLPNDAVQVHTSTFTLRWSDMDAFGQYNNAMYFTYFEQVRVDWLRTLGVDHALVLANVSCTFFRPLNFPADIEVALYAGPPGRSSLQSYYQIRVPEETDELFALGHGTIVWYDHAGGHSVAVPETVRRTLNESV